MAVAMTTLRRGKNGDWLSRKAIPADVREAYSAAHSISHEERFRKPGTMPLERAKQEMREWDAEVSGRITAFRASARGEALGLTHKETHRLAGEWYTWFVAVFEDEPGEPVGWDLMAEHIPDAYSRFASANSGNDEAPVATAVRRFVRAKVSEVARVPSFLAERAINLAPDSYDTLLDLVEQEFPAALGVLRRRATGDYGPDTRLERFPKVDLTRPRKVAGMTPWQLFEAWIAERKPASSTINRWRGVLAALNTYSERRDIAAITNEDAIKWKDTLVTEKRTGVTVNGIWLNAAHTVFEYALTNKKIASNPFEGVRVRYAP